MEQYTTPYYRQLSEVGFKLPAFLCHIRTEYGRECRRQCVERFSLRFLTPRTDGICGTLTTVLKDNLYMINTIMTTNLVYHKNPTKEDLLEYFSERIRIRKMTEREALRLMDVDDSDIDKIKAAGISKSQMYKLAGNSIVVNVLYHIFRTMFIPNQPETTVFRPTQLSFFD